MWPNIEQARAMMTFHKYSILIDLYDDFKKKRIRAMWQNIKQARAIMTFYKYFILIDLYDDIII
jgi:hypothetical protein